MNQAWSKKRDGRDGVESSPVSASEKQAELKGTGVERQALSRYSISLAQGEATLMRTEFHRKQLGMVLFWLVLCASLFTAVPTASAQFQAWVMAKLPDTPEGMAIDSQGSLYTTLFHTGEIVRLKDDGSYAHIAWVPSKEESG
jgi:hypothetical protein